MTASLLPLQKAVLTVLSGAPALETIPGVNVNVYDAPPDDAAFPYIVIGEATAAPLDGAEGGLVHTLTLRIFSRHGGRSEVKAIADAVFVTLQDIDLSVPGLCPARMRHLFTDVLRRRENGVVQGVLRYRAITVPEPA